MSHSPGQGKPEPQFRNFYKWSVGVDADAPMTRVYVTGDWTRAIGQLIGTSALSGVHEFYSMFINLSQVNGAMRGRDVASFGFLPVSQRTGPP
jgi:hypothetical protein